MWVPRPDFVSPSRPASEIVAGGSSDQNHLKKTERPPQLYASQIIDTRKVVLEEYLVLV